MLNCDTCGVKLDFYYPHNNLNFCSECFAKIAEGQATEAESGYWEMEPLEEENFSDKTLKRQPKDKKK